MERKKGETNHIQSCNTNQSSSIPPLQFSISLSL